MTYRIFISSVQREFAKERKALADYIRKDMLLGMFFDVFLFERTTVQDRSAANLLSTYESSPHNGILATAMQQKEYRQRLIADVVTGQRQVVSERGQL